MTFSDHITNIEDTLNHHFKSCYQVASWLSANPEVSGSEAKACAAITSFLSEEGYDTLVNYCKVPHAFLARKNTTSQKPRIAILCEYDALEGLGHACGHSISCGISLLTALTLLNLDIDFPFEFDLIGTPAEEIQGGKIKLMNNHAFDGYQLAIMAHLYSSNAPFFNTLSAANLEVIFHGKSAHASTDPWEGNNALNGTQLLFHSVDMMRQHLPRDYQLHGIITNGGVMPSIVPDLSSSFWYPRAASLNDVSSLIRRMTQWAQGAALSTETTVTVKTHNIPYGEIFNGSVSTDLIEDVFKRQGLTYQRMLSPGGSTDAGSLDYLLPVLHPMIAIGNDPTIKLHSPEFLALVNGSEGINALKTGAMVLLETLWRLSFEPDTYLKLKNEHAHHRGLPLI